MEKGQKVWIRNHLGLKEAVILSLEANGKLVHYAYGIGEERISWLYKLLHLYFDETEPVEEFKAKFV